MTPSALVGRLAALEPDARDGYIEKLYDRKQALLEDPTMISVVGMLTAITQVAESLSEGQPQEEVLSDFLGFFAPLIPAAKRLLTDTDSLGQIVRWGVSGG